MELFFKSSMLGVMGFLGFVGICFVKKVWVDWWVI